MSVTAGDGLRIHVESHGDGPVVLLSPGFCQTHENTMATAIIMGQLNSYKVITL